MAKISLCILGSALILCLPIQATALDVVEGEWEFTVKYTVSGMPIDNPEEHYRECITQDNPIPTAYLQARSCHVLEQRERHRTIFFKLNCMTEHGPVISEGKIHFTSLKITGDSKIDLGDVAGKTTVMRYKFTGRRLGECR